MSETGAKTIRTQRLRLRMPEIDDFAAYAQLMASPRDRSEWAGRLICARRGGCSVMTSLSGSFSGTGH